MSTSARIVLVGLAQLPSDLIKAALGQDLDASVVAVVHELEDLPRVVAATGANMLIVSSEHPELPRKIRELIEGNMPPDAAVIPLDGSGVVLYALRLHVVAMGDVSCAELVAAIRRSVSERAAG
jgi:hypothetical protein